VENENRPAPTETKMGHWLSENGICWRKIKSGKKISVAKPKDLL
jgi:hypothetical protein